MRIKRSVILGLTAAVIASGAVLAASHAPKVDPAVTARQAHMKLYGFNLGVLGAMAKGEMDFDAGKAQAAADNLLGLVSMNQAAYWIPGTSSSDIEGTRLKAAVFEKYEDARKIGMDLHAAAVAMQAAAGSLDGVRASIGAVGGACGACHKAFREPAN